MDIMSRFITQRANMQFPLSGISRIHTVLFKPTAIILLLTTIIHIQALLASSQSLLFEAEQLLDEGNLTAARKTYSAACSSKDPAIRLTAYVGLARVYRQIPGKRMESLRNLRKAQYMEPGNLDVFYEIALTGFAFKDGSGTMMADNALTEIICQDPGYRDAYSLWRVEIRGRSRGNMEKVAECLPAHIASDPSLGRLWLEIAYDWFGMFKTENSLAALDSLLQVAPEHKPQERLLLRARCLLSTGDKSAFEAYYNQALREAELEGDFSRLIAETKLIFIPAEDSILQSLQTVDQIATFFHLFWRNKDPDPTTPRNERLIEHYERLREAELNYRVLTPDGLVNNSDNYLRLMSRTDEFAGAIETAEYEYDPAKVFNRNAPDLYLDHRGLLFIRHGPPDGIQDIYIYDRRDGFVENLGAGGAGLDITNSSEWRYGNNKIIFKSGMGTGGYLYYPSVSSETVDIKRAMQTQTYKDPLPLEPQDYYNAAFLRSDGRLGLEFYQSVQANASNSAEAPEARLVLYDRMLNEMIRDVKISVAAPSPDGDLWLALTSVPVEPSDYAFALSMGLNDIRAVVKSKLHLEPIDETNLSTSDIVLGVEAGGIPGIFRRGEVELLPRPSLEFKLDEPIETLVEVYNLRTDLDGRREYVVSATIKLIKQDRNRIGKLLEKFRLLGQERGSELTMKFTRVVSTDGSIVVESFTIDTSELVPGMYILLIVIKDSLNGMRTAVQRHFKLVD